MRRVRVDYQIGWLVTRKVSVTALRLQSDTFLACGLLAETLGHRVDTFQRDYLVERLDDQVEHRVLTGYYPHLSLSIGQSFASKGGYIVHFAEAQGHEARARQRLDRPLGAEDFSRSLRPASAVSPRPPGRCPSSRATASVKRGFHDRAYAR